MYTRHLLLAGGVTMLLLLVACCYYCPPAHMAVRQLLQLPLIPARLHQTWKRKQLSPEYQANQDTWRTHNPSLQVHFYDDQDIAVFVRQHYPQYWQLYQARTRPVERADLLRYMAVHHHGGFYADMDTSCHKSLEPLRRHPCVVGIEFFGEDGEPQYLQWFFGAVAGHPLMLAVLDEVQRRHESGKWDHEHPDVQTLKVTGPQAFTAAVRTILRTDPNSIEVHEPGVFGAYRMHLQPAHMRNKAYLTHHFHGEWKEYWPQHLRD